MKNPPSFPGAVSRRLDLNSTARAGRHVSDLAAWRKRILTGSTLAFFLGVSPVSQGAVPNADITLQPVVTDNLPIFTVLSVYGSSETSATTPGWDTPLYAPYDATTPGWYDNIVAEQLQARLPVVMLETTGTFTTNPVDWTNCPGGINGNNPYRTINYINAVNRAGAGGLLKFGLFYQGAAQGIYTRYYGLPSGTLVDFANTDSWDKIWWQRIIKPWFETVPSSYWYSLGGKLPIEFWGLNIGTQYTNQQGNLSQLFTYLAAQIQSTYGVTACFFMGSVNCDTTLATCPSFVGDNEWFFPPSTPYTMTTYKSKVWGGMVAGFDPHNGNPNSILLRNGVTGTGAIGDTFKSGLDAAVSSNSYFNVIEGYSDLAESCGLYRAVNAKWAYPSQYLNMMRTYSDLRTVTLKLEAEGADEYADTTTGNSGGSFLRSPEDLDVRALTGAVAATASSFQGTAVAAQAFDGNLTNKWFTPTNAPGWLQYDYGTGNKNVVNTYYLTSANDVPARDPASWQFQGSNNGTTWTTLDTRTGEVFAARAQTNVYTCVNTTAYQYYRLNITATAGTGSGIQLADLYLKATGSTGGGWAVTNTAANEWIQFDGITLSEGNYKFPIKYSSTAAHTVRLLVDGVALPDVSLPSSGSMSTFTTAYLGSAAITHGSHTLRLFFVDGGVDVDWVFVKKYDPLTTLKSASTNLFLQAVAGGNSTVVANSSNEGGSEKFSIDDLTGAGTVSSGDVVKLQSKNGLYLTATGGGGSTLTVNKRTPGTTENFTVVRISGSGALASGDQIALRSSDGTHYVTVAGATSVNVSGTAIGVAQTFTVNLSAQ